MHDCKWFLDTTSAFYRSGEFYGMVLHHLPSGYQHGHSAYAGYKNHRKALLGLRSTPHMYRYWAASV